MNRIRIRSAACGPRALWVPCLVVSLLFLSCHGARPAADLSPATDPRSMRFPLPEFEPPQPQRVTLPNGMVLFLMEDHDLPLIHLQVMVRTGGIYDPPQQIGLAELAGSLLRSGGTKQRSGDEVDRWVDQVAAELSVGIGLEACGITLDLLKQDMDVGLGLLAEMMQYPTFAEEKLTVAKNNALEAILRRNDRPATIANRLLRQQLYGEAHPYARESTEATIGAIRREDLVAFHQKYFVPNQTMMGVTGDFDTAEMIQKIEAAFSGWKPKEVRFQEVPPAVERAAGLYLVSKPISQTQLRLGHLGIRQGNPDFFAVSILDDILGAGGFSSRLFSDIRTRQGLAYSVGSVFQAGGLERGLFVAYAETRSEGTEQTLLGILTHIQKIREEKVSEEEWLRARDAFLNAFIFSFASPAQIVGRRISLEYDGLPSNYLEQYRNNVARVTREDILRVARKYLHPERLVILAVGDGERFSLDTFQDPFGPIQRITPSQGVRAK